MTLTQLEKFQFEIVDILAGQCTRALRTKLTEVLAQLRAEKASMLKGSTALRKTTPGPADKDRLNAQNPDEALTTPQGQMRQIRMYQAPPELCDGNTSLHTCRGLLPISTHGQVVTDAAHTDLHRELVGRGFALLHGNTARKIDPSDPRFSGIRKQRIENAVASALFRPSRLAVIGGPGQDMLRALHDRVGKAAASPTEARIVDRSVPQPGDALFCRSAADFRAHYLGERR
jgi:hypothetical protein